MFLTDYLQSKLIGQGYRLLRKTNNDLFMLSPEDQKIWVCYLDKPAEVEFIRRCFEFPGHVLFVVDEKLIPEEITSRENTDLWLRTLHGLYMGRVYTYNERLKLLYGLHFDYDTGDVTESPRLDPLGILCVETGTWLRGWTGTYRIARFYDSAWWTVQNPFQGSQSSHRQTYDNTWRGQKQTYDHAWAKQEPPKQEASKRDFMREFMACRTEQDAKSLYKKLAREFHPDVSEHPNALVMMQQINAAWDKAKVMW